MATLLIKFTDEKQYDSGTKTITYRDASSQRWIDTYGKLEIGDNCIFHSSTNKLYVGDFSSKSTNTSITFNNIEIADISLDDLFRISELKPETVTVFKRPPGPVLKNPTIDVNLIYREVMEKKFVSFFIIKQGTEAEILPSLKEGDRVVTIDKDNNIVDLFTNLKNKLTLKNFTGDLFGAKGKSLTEILNIMIAQGKSNHIKNINRVILGLEKGDSYKFPSFNDYYNIMHNKLVYSKVISDGESVIPGDDISDNTKIPDQYILPSNSILYGPPGTGKTFHSVNYAVAIVENKEVEAIANEERELVKARFDYYVKDGQIVFCTFHQSLSYEDFIEGIKPIEPESEDDQLYYAVEDGMFKRLCTEAAFSFVKRQTTVDTENAIDFSTAYDILVDTINEKLSQGEKIEIPTRSGGSIKVESVTQKGNIRISHVEGNRTYCVSKKRLSKIAQAFPDLTQVTNINDQFRAEIGGSNTSAYWAVLNATRTQSVDTSVKKEVKAVDKVFSYEDKKEVIESFTSENYKVDNPKKFVLVIDEINRGNVSQIFGELITLIEDDKRLGKEEELKATLPYSKESFGVPLNVYIVGTMNTADRSVEALDTALRRRFSFVPKMPEEQKLRVTDDGIDLPKLLQTINTRLRILKDSDHTIGHAWFWSVSNTEQLKVVFEQKILPLLQEYFYNDYEKLGLVLGDSFFEPHTQIASNVFATFTGGNGLAGQYDQSWQYALKPAIELTTADFRTLEIQNTQPELDEAE